MYDICDVSFTRQEEKIQWPAPPPNTHAQTHTAAQKKIQDRNHCEVAAKIPSTDKSRNPTISGKQDQNPALALKAQRKIGGICSSRE